MEDVVLPNTSLCAIIRDEVMNPAGGILRFLRSVMPHVEEGIVADTGSVDGTRDVLEDAKREFPNLRVYDIKFEGYAEARNYSLKQATKKKALVLDADEIIRQEDYSKIYDWMCRAPLEKRFRFLRIDVFPEEEVQVSKGIRARLFDQRESSFSSISNDWLWEDLRGDMGLRIPVPFYQFLPIRDSHELKMSVWYKQPRLPLKAPSEMEGFRKWKVFNYRRDNYKASNLDLPEIAIQKT